MKTLNEENKAVIINVKNDLNMLRKGFTLAEVLLVLAVVGILASILIPSLINNTQDLMYKSAWKKEYASISQAYKIFIQDQGANTGSYYFLESTNINKYFSVSKYCSYSSGIYVPNNCWTQKWKYLNGNYTGATLGRFVMDFGSAGGGSCQADLDGYSITSTGSGMSGSCNTGAVLNDGAAIVVGGEQNITGLKVATLFVDVNGLKEPNTQGKDIYAVYLIQDGKGAYTLPVGSVTDWKPIPATCAPSGDGLSCSAEYIKQ